ncbi:universal stress protein [Haloplanus sp. GCM10025708]|uniref:universal stress protein n=1 Tax=Haloferacaceae TaxID=1644056 RepID=UPI0036229F69
MYDEILIPTDGSEGAERGVEHGLDIAEKYDADVHTLYVVDETTYGETPALSSEELYLEQIRESGRDVVDDVVDRAEDRSLDATGVVERGDPYERITDYADDRDVDLIVMGVHGTGAHGQPHIGPVTDRVLRTTDVPVFPV